MTQFIQVSTTADSKRIANRIARVLLDERIASCVQVLGPVQSTYWWKGRHEHAKEWICLIKGMANDYAEIQGSIKRIHSYKVPEILAFPVLYGDSDYLEWTRKETTRRRAGKPNSGRPRKG